MIKAVAIVANPKSEGIHNVLMKLVDILKRYRVDVLLEKRASEVLSLSWHTTSDEIQAKADLIVVLGGDGTILSAARMAGKKEIPIIGVHMGRLGFITEISVDDLYKTIDDIMKNRLPVQRRMRLGCEIISPAGEVIYNEHALNEVALIKGGIAKMIEFDVFADNEMVGRYKADGFIVATPTGSTGYALSTGCPIVDPRMNLILLTAICPHSLSNRELVVSPETVIRIQITEERQDIFVSQDGQVGRNLKVGETLIIKRTDFDTILYHKEDQSFYKHLVDKFAWGV